MTKSAERELAHMYQLAERYRAVSAPPHEIKALDRHIRKLEEQIYGRHWQTPKALHSSPPGGGAAGPAGPITFTQYMAQQLPRLYPGAINYARPEPEPYSPPVSAGIRAGEIVAWRGWKVRDGLLTSTYKEDVWRPGEVMQAHDDPVKERYQYRQAGPGSAVHIGIFAWKELFDLTEYTNQLLTPDIYYSRIVFGELAPELTIAIGQILIWGSVVEHEKGYRAQYAKVHKIMIGPDVEGLRKTYGVTGI